MKRLSSPMRANQGPSVYNYVIRLRAGGQFESCPFDAQVWSVRWNLRGPYSDQCGGLSGSAHPLYG